MALFSSDFPLIQISRGFPLPFPLLILLRVRGIFSFFFFSFDQLSFGLGFEGARVVGGGREAEPGVGSVKDPNGIHENDAGSVDMIDAGVQEGGEL